MDIWEDRLKRVGNHFEKVSGWRQMYSREIAIFVIDPWDIHWCKEMTDRLQVQYNGPMNEWLLKVRKLGMQVVMAPNNALKPYLKAPQYTRMLKYNKPPPPNIMDVPPHPFICNECEKGACGDCCHDNVSKKPKTDVWSSINDALALCDSDVISVEPKQLYPFLKEQNIKHIVFIGGATNQCIMNRPFGSRYFCQRSYGFDCVLVRDLSEVSLPYNIPSPVDPARRLEIPEAERLIWDFIELNIMPTSMSHEFTRFPDPDQIAQAASA